MTTPPTITVDATVELLRTIQSATDTRHRHLTTNPARREHAELPPVVLVVDECALFSAVTALTHAVKESRS